MEELIHIDNLCSRCGFFTSDTSVNGGYGCNHKDCDDGEYIYNGDIIDWHKAYRIVAIRLTKRNIAHNKVLFDVQMNTWWCGWITIKTFVASDICTDSIDYAKACAQELLDKLREELP